MSLYETTIRTNPEGDAGELQALYQSYFPGQTLSPADIDYYTKAGGVNALLQEFEGLKPIGQPTINVQPASPAPSADNWMPGVIFDQSKLPANFDWQNYLTRYSDLGAAGIDTPLEAQRHYALYGSTEGRQFAPEVANQDAVKNLYQSVLGREADPGGLAYWVSQFGSDVSPEEEAAFRQASQAEIAARPPAGGLSVLSQDDKEQAAIDAATIKPSTNTYRGVQIPDFTDQYVDRGDEGFQVIPASQLRDQWMQEQDRLASLTPAQKAIESVRYVQNLEGSNETAYMPVTFDGKDWTVTAGGNSLMRLADDQSGLGPKQYRYEELDAATGQIRQGVGVEGPGLWKSFLTNPVTGMALGLLLPGVGQAIGSALGATGAAAGALGSGVLNFGLQVATGADPVDALKGAVLSAGAGWAGAQVGSMLPAELTSAGKNAITQLITTGKLDPAALATSVGTSFATDTLAAETGLDKATAGKLVTAGLQAFSGNELAALTSLAQAGIQSGLARTGTTAGSSQDRAAFLEANASPLGAGALSPIPAEDEQIAQQQRVTAANQAISDYLGPGNDLSREGLVSNLQSLGFSATDAENYAKQADAQINQQRVGADVMNRYSRIDPEFGTPALDRQTAVTEMVAAGFSEARANELLNGIDAQNAIKLENKLSVQSAYQNFISGKGTEQELRSAMTSAGYSDADINNLAVKGRGIIEGQTLTAGEQVQERAATLPDIRAEIAAKPTFNEAYATAREKLGAGATFTWQGKTYVASSAEERPDLTAEGMAAKALQGDPQFQVALSETALQNQRSISQVLSDYSQKGGDLTRESAIDRLEKLGVTKDQASFFLDQKDGKLPYTFDQFKSAVPTANADSYRAYVVAFNELKNKGVPTSLIDISGYAASGARPNMPALINGISTAFGMGAEAAGNTLKAFGTMGEALGFNTAQMADFGRKLENIAQELYPQSLIKSEEEIKARFASATNAKQLGMAIVDSVLNNPGAVAKMIGVEGIQEIPNIALALSTGGAYGALRYAGLLAGMGLDVVESAGLQGAQKVEEGLAKGLSRAAAVKGAVDDMKTAGAVTAIMTAAADKVPFGGTIAKTIIKGSASEGIEEYVIARATGADHMSALRQAAFGSLIGGPTEASLQGAGNLTSVVINGDAMVGTYADGTKVTITEPAGATQLKIDVSAPSIVAGNVTSTITSDLNNGVDLNTAINNVVIANAGSDLSGTIDGVIKAVSDSGADIGATVIDLTASASKTTGNSDLVINNVVGSLAANNVDLNANAGSVVAGALSSGTSVSDAVNTTLAAVTNNGGKASEAAVSIIDAVAKQTGGDAAAVIDAGGTIIANSNGDKSTITNVIAAADSSTNGNLQVIGNLVGDVAKTGDSDAAAAAVDAAITSTNGAGTEVAIGSALNNGANANTVLSTASNTLVATGGDASAAVSNVVNAGLSNNVDASTAVSSAANGAVAAGANINDATSASVSATIVNAVISGGDANTSITDAVSGAVSTNAANTVGGNTTLLAAADTALSTAAVTNLNTNQVVTSVIEGAVKGGVEPATAISSTVVTAINQGNDANTIVAAVTSSIPNASVDVDTSSTSTTVTTQNNNVTSSVTIDNTTGVTTTVNVDSKTNTATVTEVDASSGTTTQTTITSDGNVTTNTNLHVIPPPVSTAGTSISGTPTTGTPVINVSTPEVAGPTVTAPTVTAPTVTTPEPTTKTTTPKTATPSAAGAGMLAAASLSGRKSPEDWLGGKLLQSKELGKYYDPLAGVFDTRLPVVPEVPETPVQEEEMRLPYYTYGQEPSMDEIFGEIPVGVEEEEPVYRMGGQVMNPQFMYAKGGLSREDFRDGKHVSGPGDGQSDDIPAMLADGEFVFPADVVAALGNGSTKAGTEKLYEMMHAIRQRARSKRPKDLPPPALKSPLDYLKKR